MFLGSTGKSNFQEGVGSRKTNIEGGAWIVGRFKGGLGKKEGVVCFRRWGLIPQCTLWCLGISFYTRMYPNCQLAD